MRGEILKMSLVEEYRKQASWRKWDVALSLCPIHSGQRILDLGCGPGDISAKMAEKGALVTGVDSNSDLIEAAEKKALPGCTFLKSDLNSIQLPLSSFDGLWCSFTAAYFTDLASTLKQWMPLLKKEAWVCLIEIDDLFGHEPLDPSYRNKITTFYAESIRAQRYDFLMGRKLSGILSNAGFHILEATLDDAELSFNGRASNDIFEAWQNRLCRMNRLQEFFGQSFADFETEFLNTLSSEKHISICKVICVVGQRGDLGGQ
jgi:2-polyprenyl-3-methyl-5-hydroxy-6-metoxy-1,4-benzoquinol methylase